MGERCSETSPGSLAVLNARDPAPHRSTAAEAEYRRTFPVRTLLLFPFIVVSSFPSFYQFLIWKIIANKVLILWIFSGWFIITGLWIWSKQTPSSRWMRTRRWRRMKSISHFMFGVTFQSGSSAFPPELTTGTIPKSVEFSLSYPPSLQFSFSFSPPLVSDF